MVLSNSAQQNFVAMEMLFFILVLLKAANNHQADMANKALQPWILKPMNWILKVILTAICG